VQWRLRACISAEPGSLTYTAGGPSDAPRSSVIRTQSAPGCALSSPPADSGCSASGLPSTEVQISDQIQQARPVKGVVADDCRDGLNISTASEHSEVLEERLLHRTEELVEPGDGVAQASFASPLSTTRSRLGRGPCPAVPATQPESAAWSGRRLVRSRAATRRGVGTVG
jgi:hypothetical protein